MHIILIAAVGKNLELGYKNSLIWYLPEDLKYFRKVTTNHTIVMGKNTWLSLPHPLPNRRHVVISSTLQPNPEYELYHSPEEFLHNFQDNNNPVYIIGGGATYKAFLPYASTLLLTEVDASFPQADTYFPDFQRQDFTRRIIATTPAKEGIPSYSFVEYTSTCANN
jgi:dihydrofolate reductase